jgi:copper resistance protein C
MRVPGGVSARTLGMEMEMTRIGKALAGVAAAVIVAAAAPAALAHAAYKSSNPADGSTVASPPSSVTAEFTEPLTDASSMSVFDPCGNQVDHGDSRPTGYEMTVSMSGDYAGTYTVEFKAQSSLDSHTTSGAFTFTSSGGDPCPGSEPPPEPKTGGGSGGGGGGSSGGGSGGGSVAVEDPVASGGSGAAVASGSAGSRKGARPDGKPSGRTNRRPTQRPSGRSGAETVALQNTGSTQPAEQPAPWDLPLSGVAMAFVLCVMIGAAGGRVYAGIVAPPRR